MDDADARGCRSQLDEFANACRESTAIFRCTVERLHRQIASGTDLFAAYHELERLRLRTDRTSGIDFEKLRPQAEIELLGNEKYIGQLHYACLSLDGKGIDTYGDCIIELDERWIAHRASCFEGNTAVIYSSARSFADKLRSDWNDRYKLCVAVRACDLKPTTAEQDYPTILARIGPTPEEDVFIEVHVFGDMVSATFRSVTFVRSALGNRERVFREAIIEKLREAAVATKTA